MESEAQPTRDPLQANTTRRTFIAAGLGAGATLLLGACGGGSRDASGRVVLNNLFQQQAGYSAADLEGMTAAFERGHPNIKVKNTLVAYEALHDKIVAAAPAGTYDVVLGDCIWVPEFASKQIVVDLSDRISKLRTDEIFPGALAMARYSGRLYGMPWILDTKYLFANATILKRAGVGIERLTTWSSVVAALRAVKSKGILKYPWIGSWVQAESVVADYAQLLGAFGGRFLDDQGKPAFNSGGGVQALEFMRMLLDEGLANPDSTSANEEDCLKAFAQGECAMNLNWTFQLAAARDPKQSRVADQDLRILHTPAGSAGTTAPGCNGGQPVMIAAGSKNTDAAWEYVKFISSQPVQNRYVRDSLPIWAPSYKSPKVAHAAGRELVSVAKTQLPKMINRPQVVNYNSASHALQVELQSALLKKKAPQAALDAAAKAFTAKAPG